MKAQKGPIVVVRSRALRGLLFALGSLSLALGIIGIFVPLLPTTPFLLLSAWCFLKSSEKVYRWLYNQALLGAALRNWEHDKSISRFTKFMAVLMIALSVVLIWLKVDSLWIKAPVSGFLILVSAFILSRKTTIF